MRTVQLLILVFVLVHIVSFNDLDQAILQGMKVWVVSHGGVGSNTLANFIELNGLFVRTQQWHHTLCHAPEPIQAHIPSKLFAAVYLYGDPVLSICSMKRQGNAYLNLQKLTNRLNVNVHYTDGLLMEAIYGQFKRWTSPEAEMGSFGYKIYHLSHEDIFKTECLGLFLSNKKLKLYRHSRSNSRREKCLNSLNVTEESLLIAKEMLSYQGDCQRLLDQVMNQSLSVDTLKWTSPKKAFVPRGARGREKWKKQQALVEAMRRKQRFAIHRS